MRRRQRRNPSRRQRVEITQLKRSPNGSMKTNEGERAFPEPHGGATVDVETHEA